MGAGRDDFVPCLKGKEAFGGMVCVGSEKVAKHMLRTQLVLVRSMCLVGRLLFVSELASEVFCGLFVLFFCCCKCEVCFPGEKSPPVRGGGGYNGIKKESGITGL